MLGKTARIAVIAGVTCTALWAVSGCEKRSDVSDDGDRDQPATVADDEIDSPAESATVTPAKLNLEKKMKSEEEWRHCLSPQQFHVAREGGTEQAFTGKYWNNKEEGAYVCVCCGQELFGSDTKFDSGTGWPSFWKPAEDANVATESDMSLGMKRTEVKCSKCDAHLGHVFEDGPKPTGLRYCINSASLEFKPKAGATTPDEK